MEVPEEAIEAAAKVAYERTQPGRVWGEANSLTQGTHRRVVRWVLRALHPLIAARVRAEGKAERDAELRRWIEVGQRLTEEKRLAEAERDEHHRNWQAAEQALTRVQAEERQRIGERLSRQLVAELTSPGNGSPADQAYDSAISAALSLVYASCDLPLNARIAAGSAVPVATPDCDPVGSDSGVADSDRMRGAARTSVPVANHRSAGRVAQSSTEDPVATPTEPVDEVKCPNCEQTIRARMSDAPEAATPTEPDGSEQDPVEDWPPVCPSCRAPAPNLQVTDGPVCDHWFHRPPAEQDGQR